MLTKEAHLVDLDTSVFADDTCSRTWSIEQDPIETAHDFRELSSVVVANDDILASHSMDIRSQTLGPRLVGVVGKDQSGILE